MVLILKIAEERLQKVFRKNIKHLEHFLTDLLVLLEKLVKNQFKMDLAQWNYFQSVKL